MNEVFIANSNYSASTTSELSAKKGTTLRTRKGQENMKWAAVNKEGTVGIVPGTILATAEEYEKQTEKNNNINNNNNNDDEKNSPAHTGEENNESEQKHNDNKSDSSEFSDYVCPTDDEQEVSDQYIFIQESEEEEGDKATGLKLFGDPIRRTFSLKILGMKMSHSRNFGYFQRYFLKKAAREWGRIKHAMGHSKFFALRDGSS